jgi:hypothetical protein
LVDGALSVGVAVGRVGPKPALLLAFLLLGRGSPLSFFFYALVLSDAL